MRVWICAAGLVLVGCGETGGALPAAVPTTESAPSADGGLKLARAELSCRAGEGVGGQISELGLKPHGKASAELALADNGGPTPERYHAVVRDPATVEFVRKDRRYVITVRQSRDGTWWQEARHYCMKVGRPADDPPPP